MAVVVYVCCNGPFQWLILEQDIEGFYLVSGDCVESANVVSLIWWSRLSLVMWFVVFVAESCIACFRLRLFGGSVVVVVVWCLIDGSSCFLGLWRYCAVCVWLDLGVLHASLIMLINS